MNLCLVCQEPNQSDVQYCRHCGVELPQLPRSREGHLLRGVMLERRYEIERVLGSGGFANAYLATDTRLNRACVVKEMLRPVEASAQEIRALERNFRREVQALVALNQPGHPNIPEIYDYFSSASGNYLVMKYIQGQNLEDILDRSGALIWQEAVKIAYAVCDALLYMHARQPPVLHRDIKPANILIDQSGRIWLVDFGLSKALPTTSYGRSGTTALGTVGYTPLEQWMEMAVPASDIYALGATLHHLLTGHDPRDAFPIQPDLPQIRQEHGNFLPIREVDESLPEELEALVSRAVQRSATRRPTAKQVKHSLEELLAPAKALPPFNFRHGKVANDPTELVALSVEHWEEARDYLYSGPFQAWFETLGRHDLVRELKTLKQKERNRDIGLDKFLRTLDPKLPSAQVSAKASGTNFGRYSPLGLTKKAPTAKINLTNHGPGSFYGTSRLTQRWLHVYPRDFVLAPEQSIDLTIQVLPDELVWNSTHKNELTIYSHSEPQTFSFILRTPARMDSYVSQFGPWLSLIIGGTIFIIVNFHHEPILICLFTLSLYILIFTYLISDEGRNKK